MVTSRRGRVVRPGRGARLRLSWRHVRLAAFLRVLRWGVTAVLIVAAVAGGYQYAFQPPLAGALEFTQHTVIQSGPEGVLGVEAFDTDSDGDFDIVTAGKDGVIVYIRDGNNFERKIIDEKSAERVQVVHIDSDNVADLLVTFPDHPGVRWYRNLGGNEFSGSSIGNATQAKAFAGDIDADGDNDVVISAREGSEAWVLRRWMNNGSGSFSSATLSSDSKVTAVTIGDLDDDGYPDIVTGGDNGLQRWDYNGSSWDVVDVDDSNGNKTFVEVADPNNDGRPVIVTGDQHEDKVAYYRLIENANYERVEMKDGADALTVHAVDFDEDGDDDIVAASQDENTVYWYDNTGDAGYVRRSLATGLQSVFDVEVVDFDNDNDFDFIAGDHYRGNIYWYERTAAKPSVASLNNIQQTTDGAGRITFDVTVSDADRDPTSMRVQYSPDGDHWYKPWLLRVTADNGSVDLRNGNGYQVGSANPIDTDAHDSVKLTFLWDTKSVHNTGGPIIGDINTVQLRVIPRDSTGNGEVKYSSSFRVDNAAPAGLQGLTIDTIGEDSATLSWQKPSDSNSFSYELYYGTNHAAVLEQRSEVWDGEDDDAMNDATTTSTEITGLQANQTYTFKIFAADDYGNVAAAPSVRGITVAEPEPIDSGAPTPPPSGTVLPTPPLDPFATPTPFPTPVVGPTPLSTPTPFPTPFPTPTLEPIGGTPTPTPLVSVNEPPVADAGIDQEVNPSALVILLGTSSVDPDGGALTYRWTQLSGPPVELLSARTATPSFSAGGEGEAYVFALTVRDERGASATDTVTVATKVLEVEEQIPVETSEEVPAVIETVDEESVLAVALRPIDWFLFALAALMTLLSLIEQLLRKSGGTKGAASASTSGNLGRVVHYQTNEPVAGARVLVYGDDKKLRQTLTTNEEGEFATDFPPGNYTLGVQATGFTFAPAASRALMPEGGVLYSGGKLVVEGEKPLRIVVPVKPTGEKVGSLRTQMLHLWQVVQRLGRQLSWPIFVAGAMLNTILIFWQPSASYLILEVLYVGLVITKVLLEIRVRPAYGLVRDAITHVPLDLAVVRLFDQKTNRLVMTRVTNRQGKFFALPVAGTYRVTVTKPGYAVFSKDNVTIISEQDSVLQVTADLMPVAPQAGLAAARAAAI